MYLLSTHVRILTLTSLLQKARPMGVQLEKYINYNNSMIHHKFKNKYNKNYWVVKKLKVFYKTNHLAKFV